MMQFIDWLCYSDEGQEFAKWGVEGDDLHQGRRRQAQADADVNVHRAQPRRTKHLQKDFGFYNGVFAYGGSHRAAAVASSPPEEQEFQKVMNARKADCRCRRRTRSPTRSASRRRCGRPR